MRRFLFALSALVALQACQNPSPPASESESPSAASSLRIYTHRHYEADQVLYDLFSEQSGIVVEVSSASADELIQKMQMEGEQSPADLLITVDAGRLHRAQESGILQPLRDSFLEATIPAALREEQGHWFGFSQRARVLVYHPERVDTARLKNYADLESPEWEGRILARSSANIYNQSLLASIIAHRGPEEARNWAAKVESHLARRPQGGDRDQIKALAAGEGDVAIVNTYYLAGMLESDDPAERELVAPLRVLFPNQAGRGTHVNISGMALAKHAPNPEAAKAFMRFLLSPEAQRIISEQNREYPVNPAVAPAPVLQAWGEFKADTLPMSALGSYYKQAVILFDEVGWP